MSKRGAFSDFLVFYYHSDTLKRIRALIEAGFPVPSRQKLLDYFIVIPSGKVMLKTLFDSLHALGIPFHVSEFILVDPAKEPILAEFDWGEEREEEEDGSGSDDEDGNY